jgi:preprotein translocase subunit SecE
MAVEVARESFPRRVSTFYHDVLAEMRKVAWPDRAQIRQATLGIIAIVLFVGAVIALLDVVIQNVFVRWLPAIFSGR